ncbi:MAG TPA: response regulator [Methylomirabilota bacterium]|nr:response regulator [Methylomirabilota bacterium]
MASILVVEDEPTVLVLGESVLQRAGYETLTAGTLAEAQAVIHSDQKLDLVFTDITLPENPEGGLQMGQLVRQARPGVPVLYTSGRALTDGMKELFVERSSFLPKPYTDEQLISAVADLLRSEN